MGEVLPAVEAVLHGSWGAVGSVLPRETHACLDAALRARGPVALAEVSCSFSSHLAKVQNNSCQILLDSLLRVLGSLGLLLFMVFSGENQKCAWESLVATGMDCGAG